MIRRAWQHADAQATRQALAQLLAASVRTHQWRRLARRETAVWADGPIDRRRALAVELASSDSDTWYAVISTGLLTNDDVPWLLDQLPALPDAVAATLSPCVPRLLHDIRPDTADLILGLSPDHPAYAATAYLRGAVDLNSADVAHERRFAAEEHEYAQAILDQRTQARRAATELLDHLDTLLVRLL